MHRAISRNTDNSINEKGDNLISTLVHNPFRLNHIINAVTRIQIITYVVHRIKMCQDVLK